MRRRAAGNAGNTCRIAILVLLAACGWQGWGLAQCCDTTILSYPYVEDFEGETVCSTNCADACPLSGDWFNADTGDDMDWIVDEEYTPSSYTGPYNDHNPGTSSGNYLYTEADNCYNTTAELYSPCFNLEGLENPEFHFWYSMYGQNMGTLKLEISNDDCGTWAELWSLTGDQGDEWLQAVIALDVYTDQTVRLRFVGTTGDGYRSDMAIDDVLLREMPCCPSTVVSYPYTEDFEGEDVCSTDCADACPLSGDWFNADTGDGMDWIVDKEYTQSSYTGPYNDHNPGNSSGNYLYTEADNCYESTAVLYSPCFDLAGLENPEFHFWYSMYGQHMGTLKLEVSNDDCGTWAELWSMTGDQGEGWLRAVIDLGAYADQIVRLRFAGTTGDGYRSDMAIDDILLREVPACPATVASFPYVEDFEGEDTCAESCAQACELQGDWFNADTGDDMDWIVDEEYTQSSYTGPYNDHNPGTASGNYLYTEADNCYESTAVLYSPCFDLAGLENPEFHFWYSMYGQHMGTLELEISSDGSETWAELWSMTGDQGEGWLRAVIDLGAYADQIVRLRFAGTTGDGYRSDMAIDDILLREVPACPATVASFPYVEDFEGEDTCAESCAQACELQGDWFNADTGDDMDWIVDEEYTQSNYTGPYNDHNPGNSSGNYLYTEADDCYESTAVLYSPCFDLAGLENPEFHFWYSMYGQHMGTLELEISSDGSETWAELWSMTGDQGEGWLRAVIDLGAYADQIVRLRFAGTTGDGYRSDMAIDDILLREVPACPATVASFPYVEDFEGEDTCAESCAQACELQGDWFNADTGDDMDWIVDEDYTQTNYTGPDDDYVPGNSDGNYLYTEADGCYNSTAVLYSPCFDFEELNNPELRFGYHMYGQHMGTLRVDISNDACETWTEIWSLSGEQGDQWHEGYVDLAAYAGDLIRLRFVGTTGDGYRSDMAIDYITIDGEVTTTSSCAMTVTEYPYDEDFESESLCTPDCVAACSLLYCGWTNAPDTDGMDWIVAQYATPSAGTGPAGNHTPDLPDGRYLYTEASGCPGTPAVLYSPCFDLTDLGRAQLSFWYHMHGNGMGTLGVEAAQYHTRNWTEVWSRSGNQGDQWLRGEIDLRDYHGQKIWLRFTGTTGDLEEGDMAIDDIHLGGEDTSVGVGGLPRATALHQNVPNPFNPQTEIRYDLPAATKVRLLVLDLQGRVVRTLVDGLLMPAGRHRSMWSGCDDRGRHVATGTYFYMLRTSEFVETRRMVLLK